MVFKINVKIPEWSLVSYFQPLALYFHLFEKYVQFEVTRSKQNSEITDGRDVNFATWVLEATALPTVHQPQCYKLIYGSKAKIQNRRKIIRNTC